LRQFFSQLEGSEGGSVFFRRTLHKRSGASLDNYALMAWVARVLMVGEADVEVSKDASKITKDFLAQVVHLSNRQDGPLAAKAFLARHGIALVIEPHLPKTRLDGAAMKSASGRPIVGLTLRHDRLDSFWFTLMHELAHLALHVT